jgi:hypothetical protein
MIRELGRKFITASVTEGLILSSVDRFGFLDDPASLSFQRVLQALLGHVRRSRHRAAILVPSTATDDLLAFAARFPKPTGSRSARRTRSGDVEHHDAELHHSPGRDRFEAISRPSTSSRADWSSLKPAGFSEAWLSWKRNHALPARSHSI